MPSVSPLAPRTPATTTLVVLATLAASIANAHGAKPLTKCPRDAVVSGTVCMDKYEASVWRVPEPATANAALVRKIQVGKATRADLTAGGATQLGTTVDYDPCADNGQNCANDIYAVSLPAEIPSSRITWFQAQEACANSGKRLPTNAEWQTGANGSPDPGPDNGTTDCNSATGTASPTGSRSSCVSARGAFDMVGNVAEWVADWAPRSAQCTGWTCRRRSTTTAMGSAGRVRQSARRSYCLSCLEQVQDCSQYDRRREGST